RPELSAAAAAAPKSDALSLFEQQTGAHGRRAPGPAAVEAPPLAIPEGSEAIEAPMGGVLADLKVQVGAKVAAGETLMVISAMKMETSVAAPCDGVVTALAEL